METLSQHSTIRSQVNARIARALIIVISLFEFVGCQLAAQGGGAAAGVAVGDAAWSAEELATANTNCSTTAVAVNPALPKADAVLMCGCIVEDASKKWSFSDFLANEFARTETLFKDGVFDTCRTRVFAQTGGSSTPWTSTQILASRNNCVVAARDANSTISFSQASTACTCVFDVAKGRWTYDAFVQNETAYTKAMVDDGTVGTCLASTLQGTQSTALSKYEGSWRTECFPYTDSYWTSASFNLTLSFQNNSFVKEVRMYHRTDCNLLMSKTIETFTVRQTGVDSANEADRLNFTRTGATLRYFSWAAGTVANLSSQYGYTDWDLGVQHDVLSKPRSTGQTPSYLRDEIVFDLVRISGARLYLGKVTSELDRSTDAKRPNTLWYLYPYNYLWDTNLPPTFLSAIPNQNQLIGSTFSDTPTASDPDGDTISYRCAKNCPTGLTVSSTTGSIIWPLTTKGTFNDITIEASDGKAASTVAFNVEVTAFSDLSISSSSPGSSLTPNVTLTLGEESTVTLYSDNVCSTSISSGTLLPSGTHPVTTNSLPANATTSIYIKAIDSQQNASACTRIGTYTNDSAAPILSALSITTPSPGTTLTPTVAVTLSDAGTVTLYNNDSCSVAISGAVSKTSGSQTLVTNSLPANATTPIYIKVLDSLLNSSTCTIVASYTHDNAAPTLSGLSVITSSPGSTLTPTVAFTLSEGGTVTLYSNSGCSVAISGAVSKSGGSQTLVTNSLTANVTTTIYIKALDSLLNASLCTSVGSYTNDTAAPALSALSITTPSPGTSLTPTVAFTLSEAGTVTLYNNSGCSVAISGAVSKSVGSQTVVTNSLTANAVTTIYIMALDSSLNASLCTSVGSYTNDTAAPTLSALSITTPSPGTTLNPTVAFTLSEAGTVTLYNSSDCSVAISSPATKTSGTQTLVTNPLAANATTTINIKVMDALLNASPCTNVGSYTTDGEWTPTTLTGAPMARYHHTAVWTGSKMIVWGGFDGGSSYLDSGGQYDPVANSWSATTLTGAPTGRKYHTAVWTDSKMIIWGGDDGSGTLSSGGLYDPTSNLWSATAISAAPTSRSNHTAVWTGSKMIVWGGSNGAYLNDGGQYDPNANSWSATSATNAPTGRSHHTALWTGSNMIVWGGDNGISALDTGGQFNPTSNIWSVTTLTAAPVARMNHTAVWTGAKMIIWAGFDGGSVYLNTGGQYDPTINSWSSTTTTGAPAGRRGHTSVWTGSKMIVWGGLGDDGLLNTGRQYDPFVNSWSATSLTGVPSARSYHNAVWTGSKMIIWGGIKSGDVAIAEGAVDTPCKSPTSNSWSAITQTGAPEARYRQTAVWTGSKMIVWGGYGLSGNLNSGGQYDPTSNSWSATTLTGAPEARYTHTAVWTGSKMIVWGGNSSSSLNTGGQYDPTSNSWSATTLTGAPVARNSHTAVWTGSKMILWGGYDGGYLNTGGIYTP